MDLMDNPEPSFWTNCLKEGVEIKLENSPVKLARKILLGTMVGDSNLRKPHDTISLRKASLRMTHSSPQMEYLLWKGERLFPLVGTFRARIWISSQGNTKVTLSSLSLKYLGHIWKDFYLEERGRLIKVLRSNVLNRMTPISIAVLYGDDGFPFFTYTHRERILDGFEIATQGFSPGEVGLLIDMFERRIGVLFRDRRVILKDGSLRFAIRTRFNRDRDTFLELVKPYLWNIKCLRYKLDPHFKKFPSYSAESLEVILQDYDMIRSIATID